MPWGPRKGWSVDLSPLSGLFQDGPLGKTATTAVEPASGNTAGRPDLAMCVAARRAGASLGSGVWVGISLTCHLCGLDDFFSFCISFLLCERRKMK